jgi:hypothetical protein
MEIADTDKTVIGVDQLHIITNQHFKDCGVESLTAIQDGGVLNL